MSRQILISIVACLTSSHLAQSNDLKRSKVVLGINTISTVNESVDMRHVPSPSDSDVCAIASAFVNLGFEAQILSPFTGQFDQNSKPTKNNITSRIEMCSRDCQPENTFVLIISTRIC
jgi:hypothetical protein